VNYDDILVDKGTYSFSSNFIKEFGDERSNIEIDASITTNSLEYLFDIETKVDFLTTQLRFKLFLEDYKTGELYLIDIGQYYNENDVNDFGYNIDIQDDSTKYIMRMKAHPLHSESDLQDFTTEQLESFKNKNG
jgi:hypothetical protein